MRQVRTADDAENTAGWVVEWTAKILATELVWRLENSSFGADNNPDFAWFIFDSAETSSTLDGSGRDMRGRLEGGKHSRNSKAREKLPRTVIARLDFKPWKDDLSGNNHD